MAKHVIQCRICGKKFDTNDGVVNIDWVMPSKGFYYHKDCYDNWRRKKNDPTASADDEMWFESLKEYLSKDIKAQVNWPKLTSQWNNFLKQGKTAKGIYFTIRYFYDIAGGDPKKAQGGIGIVPEIYQESSAYWYERNQKEKDTVKKIEELVMARQQQKVVILKPTKKNIKTDKARFSLADVEDDE